MYWTFGAASQGLTQSTPDATWARQRVPWVWRVPSRKTERPADIPLKLGIGLPSSAKNRDDTSVSGPVIVSSRGVYGCSSLAFASERVDYSVLVIR